MKHPSRNYITYLISKRSLSAVEIWAQLLSLGLPVPNEDITVTRKKGSIQIDNPSFSLFLDTLKGEQRSTVFPPGYDPTNLKHGPTADFLRSKKIYDMWAGDPFVGTAVDLLNEPQIKRMIEVMLVGPLSYNAIARRIAKRYGFPLHVMNPRVVQSYAHYFWDFHALDRSEWMEIMQEWMGGYISDYRTSLLAPRTPTGAALSGWVADGGLEPLRDVHRFRAIRDTSFLHFMSCAVNHRPGQSTADSMLKYFMVITQAQEHIDMRQGGSAEVLEELRRLEPVYDESPMTTALELPADSLSVIDVVGEEVKTEEKQ
jgi:hypothetical protein